MDKTKEASVINNRTHIENIFSGYKSGENSTINFYGPTKDELKEMMPKTVSLSDDDMEKLADKVSVKILEKTTGVLTGIKDNSKQQETKQELELVIEKLKKELEEKNKILESNGTKATFPCPYCGYYEERKVLDGECRCSICGHGFKNIDPTEDKAKYNDWKEKHKAKLKRVSKEPLPPLYRMKLEKYAVSDKGVLIIPNKTCEEKEVVTTIAFCKPNIGDELSIERLTHVKTLVLSEGVQIDIKNPYEGKIPFSDLMKLENVLIWDANNKGYKKDEEILKQIKGEQA